MVLDYYSIICLHQSSNRVPSETPCGKTINSARINSILSLFPINENLFQFGFFFINFHLTRAI